MPPDLYAAMKLQFQQAFGTSDFDIVRYAITYGARDGWNGWRTITWTQTTTEDAIIVPKGITLASRIAGLYPRLDAVALTKSTFAVGDFLRHTEGVIPVYYEVQGIKDLYPLDSATLVWRELELSQVTMHEAKPGATTWTKTRSEDPRHKIKDWIDGYARSAQITKDNDSTQATWACIFSNPPYPLSAEFRAAASAVQGLYVVDNPNSTPVVGHDKYIEGYIEHVPTHIITVDSTACNGTALQWKMVEELRYVNETYPFGSCLLMESQRPHDIDIGGMMLHDCEWTLQYERNTTT